MYRPSLYSDEEKEMFLARLPVTSRSHGQTNVTDRQMKNLIRYSVDPPKLFYATVFARYYFYARMNSM